MLSSESVSKGFFVHVPKQASKKNKVLLPDPLSYFSSEEWHKGFTKVWKRIEKKLNTIDDDVMQVLLNDLVSFVESSPPNGPLIPTVLLLTGVNLPDHCSLFNRLKSKLSSSVTPHVAMLSSCDCSTLKQTVELIVAQFTKNTSNRTIEMMEVDDDDDDSEPEEISVKKSDCTMPFLAKWYTESTQMSTSTKNKKPVKKEKLVIVFKDFEGFQQKILHHLILILSGYLDRLPLVLVFGVSTTEAAIGESLTHQITSRLMLKVFQSQPSVYFLNNTVDKIFLTADCPFQLSGKLFKFFTDVFLFYDFSVNRFTQGIKYCVMDHFYGSTLNSLLCQKLKKLDKNVLKLNYDLLEEIRAIPSFKNYIESHKNKKSLLTSDTALQKEVLTLMTSLRREIDEFYTCLRILHILVKDLPQSPLGKQLREVYCTAISKDITKTLGYKDSHQILAFISKDELEKKIKEILALLVEKDFPEIVSNLEEFHAELQNIGLNPQTKSPVKSPSKIDLNVKNRSQLKQRLAEIGSRPQMKVGYEALRDKIVEYFMCSLLPAKLTPYSERTVLWEIVTIQDIDARNRVVPRIRAPIHTALNNPHHYLQCNCCKITDENSILSTMPDVCIAYKLHLEGGSIINIYDWLQSFSMIVDSESEKKNVEDVDEKVQARFTQALAELEFLGFIKSSRSKPDHVSRLTWGSSS